MSAHWHIPSTTWPATATDGELTPDQVLDVLDQFDEYYPAALASLAETELPPLEAHLPSSEMESSR